MTTAAKPSTWVIPAISNSFINLVMKDRERIAEIDNRMSELMNECAPGLVAAADLTIRESVATEMAELDFERNVLFASERSLNEYLRLERLMKLELAKQHVMLRQNSEKR